jgi:hypothetical protein
VGFRQLQQAFGHVVVRAGCRRALLNPWLRSMLREYYPAALAPFGADLAGREALAVLGAAPPRTRGVCASVLSRQLCDVMRTSICGTCALLPTTEPILQSR